MMDHVFNYGPGRELVVKCPANMMFDKISMSCQNPKSVNCQTTELNRESTKKSGFFTPGKKIFRKGVSSSITRFPKDDKNSVDQFSTLLRHPSNRRYRQVKPTLSRYQKLGNMRSANKGQRVRRKMTPRRIRRGSGLAVRNRRGRSGRELYEIPRSRLGGEVLTLDDLEREYQATLSNPPSVRPSNYRRAYSDGGYSESTGYSSRRASRDEYLDEPTYSNNLYSSKKSYVEESYYPSRTNSYLSQNPRYLPDPDPRDTALVYHREKSPPLASAYLDSSMSSSRRYSPATADLDDHGDLATAIPASDGNYRRACYFTNWARYRKGVAAYNVEDIDPFLCTHILYAFAILEGNKITSPDPWADHGDQDHEGMYNQINSLKQTNPELKTLISVGGWSFGAEPWVDLTSSRRGVRRFVNSVVQFCRKWDFDGVDIDWEVPEDEDKDAYSYLLHQLKTAFIRESEESGKEPLLLSAAVKAINVDEHYHVSDLAKYLDFANLMSYDFHGEWDEYSGHHSTLFHRSTQPEDERYKNTASAAAVWSQLGFPRHKMNIGIAAFGKTLKLEDSQVFGLGAPLDGGGRERRYTKQKGFAAYYEVCNMVERGAQRMWHPEHYVPYAYLRDQWVGYDDPRSLEMKTNWIKQEGYGGVMVWALDLDDFSGCFCSQGRYPLLSALQEGLPNARVDSQKRLSQITLPEKSCPMSDFIRGRSRSGSRGRTSSLRANSRKQYAEDDRLPSSSLSQPHNPYRSRDDEYETPLVSRNNAFSRYRSAVQPRGNQISSSRLGSIQQFPSRWSYEDIEHPEVNLPHISLYMDREKERLNTVPWSRQYHDEDDDEYVMERDLSDVPTYVSKDSANLYYEYSPVSGSTHVKSSRSDDDQNSKYSSLSMKDIKK